MNRGIANAHDLGVTVRAARNTANLTQAQLADKAGVSRPWVVRLEQGETGLEIGRVFQVLRALNLNLQTVEAQAVSEHAAALDQAFKRARS